MLSEMNPATESDAEKAMTNRRVLFIDDDEAFLKAVSRYFAKRGFRVFTALNGRDGIKEFLRVSPHVTVVDLNMPGITGMHVLEELRSKRPVMIMLTSEAEIENAVEAMRRGAENFLTKAVSMSHLEVVVAKAAEKAEMNREIKTLRARLEPNRKRKMARAAVLVLLVVVSVLIGSLIGGRQTELQEAPIPVPFNPQDTVIEREDAPLRPFPVPEKGGTEGAGRRRD